MAFVYLLLSNKDRKKYIGSTVNLDKRLQQHNRGEVTSTQYRRPLKLIGYQIFETIEEASIFEKKYKRSHGTLERAIKKGQFVILTGD